MPDSPNVFLLKNGYRLVATDGRISGNWHVLLDERRTVPENAEWLPGAHRRDLRQDIRGASSAD